MTAPAPIIVTAMMAREDQAWLEALRRAHYPAGRNLVPAHLTLFHHLPPSLAPEVRERLGVLAREGRPAARIAGLVSLGQGVAYRIDSPELEAVRAGLAELWAGLLTPQDVAPWRPHVTIQNKVAPEEARVLLDRLKAEFRARPLAIAGYAAWYYRGGPWEALSRHLCA